MKKKQNEEYLKKMLKIFEQRNRLEEGEKLFNS